MAHPSVAALVLDADLLPLRVAAPAQNLDNGLLVRAEAFHGLPERVGVRGRVKAGRRPDGALQLGSGVRSVRSGQGRSLV